MFLAIDGVVGRGEPKKKGRRVRRKQRTERSLGPKKQEGSGGKKTTRIAARGIYI